MNKLFTKIAALCLGATMAVGVGVAVASNSKAADPVSAAATSYTITFNGNNSESTTISTSTTAASITGSSTYVTGNVATATKAYGATSDGVKLGTSSASGTIKVNLSSSGQVTPTSIVVYAKLYNSGKSATLGVNGSTKKSVSGSFANITFNYTTALTYIQIDVTKYVWVKSVTVNYNSGPTKLTTPSPSYDDTTKKVSWSVEHASSYQVKVDSGSYAAGTSPYDVSDLATGVSHTIYVIAKGDGTNYTDSDAGSTTFTPTAPKVLSSISVSGQTTTFEQNDTFVFGGTVTAHYTDSTSSDVTASATFSGYNMATVGNQTVTVSYTLSGTTKTTTYSITVTAGPDVVLNTSNKPYTSTSSSNTGTEEVTLDGIQYNSYAAYIYNSYLSFNRSQSGAYLYNNTAFAKNIKKIVVNYNLGGSSYFTMYEGSAAGSEGATISPSASGIGKITYTFSDANQFFKFKLTTTGTYCNIVSISIYLGSSHKTLSSIAVETAPSKTAYKSGETFNAAGLVITATYSDESTEDIAYNDVPTAFSFSPETITTAGNVTISYGGATCYQAVSLITVTNVTSVESAPSEVYKDGSINPADVVLNVVYSDSSVGTVTPDTVTCDTSSLGQATATATYDAATGTKSATFNVEVVREPSYDYVIDELTVADTGISGTTYGDWSGVTKLSGSVYAGNTNENNNGGIGMRQDTSKVPAGIIVTSSGGVATKVQLTWTTTTARTIHIKGQNEPYTSVEFAANVTGTEVGTIAYSSTTVDLSAEYQYICIYVTGGAAGLSSIKITWKIEGAADPLVENPTLSTGAEADVHVGRNLALTVTTNPVDSDEKLIVSSSNENYVTVSGAGRNYVIHGVAEGSATVTVAGAKGQYSSSVLVTVSPAVKSFDDKIMTPDDLGITSYDSTDTTYYFNNVPFIVKQVMKSGGFQFKKDEGYFYNSEALYSTNNIKAVTLIMKSSNTNEPTVYEGSTAGDKTTSVSPKTTFVAGGVNTYLFSGSTQFFRIDASTVGACVIERIIVELEDSASTVLSHARSAASTIIDALKNTCGAGNSGVVTQSQWDSLTASLTALNLTEDDKLFLKEATRIAFDDLLQGSATIENAMAHYDYCVTKFGFTPFTGITTAQPNTRFTPLANITGEGNAVAIVVIVSVISLSAIGGYFFLRKRKEN